MALPVIVQKPSKATLRSNTSDCTDAAEGSVEKFAYKVTNGSSDFMIKLYFTLGIVSILLALVGMTIGMALFYLNVASWFKHC
jgi:hypothetical protein